MSSKLQGRRTADRRGNERREKVARIVGVAHRIQWCTAALGSLPFRDCGIRRGIRD
jgi:hypothetical protein